MRKIQLANDEYYHIYNRGVDKRIIFNNNADFSRFLRGMSEFNAIEPIGSIFENSFRLGSSTPKSAPKPKAELVNIVCYCLNPNHYHMILQQVADRGIEKFMHKVSTGYTNYFNLKNKRSGVLFQGRYKAIHINSNEYLLHLSAYVNLNYEVHALGSSTPKSSWGEYKKWQGKGICEKSAITGNFKNFQDYEKFAKMALESIKNNRELRKELELGS